VTGLRPPDQPIIRCVDTTSNFKDLWLGLNHGLPFHIRCSRRAVLRASLIALSQSKSLRSLAEKTAVGQRLSRRFVAGVSTDDALRATRAMNQLSLSVSIDNLGENVTNVEEAHHSAQLYHQLLEEMHQQKLNANVSLKLTHIGLDVDESLAYELASGLVAHAVTVHNFVRVDMEGSAYTDKTLAFVRRLHRNLGFVRTCGRCDPVLPPP
jgi:proline dehydrogenase